MTEEQIQEIADRAVAALEGMSPGTNWPVLIAAFVAFLIGLGTLWQKNRADSRAEWWRRVQWALEASASPDDDVMYDYGMRMLRVLAKKRFLVPKQDKKLFDAVWQDSETGLNDDAIDQLRRDAEPYEDGLDDQPGTGDNEGSKEGSHA